MAQSISEILKSTHKCDDIVKCVLGLKELDLTTYKNLIKGGRMTVEKLSELLGRERSTTYRSLQNLLSCGLVHRETQSIESGGYFYEYIAEDPCIMKEMIKSNVDDWYAKMQEIITDMGDSFIE
ncbi:MAG: helix-turn-helix domain-containing protein [Methanosarcinales archaeon]|nr:helix-turn-helix domain-containing protein [Methanosarcinales archaeon]